jgi:translation initiation factor IF-2
MKIHEIAAELRMQSKDVLAKAAELGIDAKNHMTNLSEADTSSLKSAIKGVSAGSAPAPRKVAEKAPKPEPAKNSPAPKKANASAKPVVDPTETEETSDGSADSPNAAPRRISRKQLEAEEKAKTTDEDGETPAQNGSDGVTESGEPKKPTRPKLKVAFTDIDEPVVKPVTSDAEATDVEAKKETAIGEVASDGKPESEVDKTEDSQKEAAEITKVTASEETLKEVSSEVKKTANERPKTSSADGGRLAPTRTAETQRSGKNQGGKGKPEAEKTSADKMKDGAGKKEKKHKGKETKKETHVERKKHTTRDNKRGRTDDFKGSPKSPILQDSSLEKRPLKSRPRPKPVVKQPEEPAVKIEDLEPGTKIINVPITVAGFAEQIEHTPSEIIMALMNIGIIANINQNIDETTAMLLGEEMGVPIFIASDEGEIVEEGLENYEDDEENLQKRPPIITVMGHVDHGKTSLLDAIRQTDVISGEAGGITQHIGAYEAHINGEKIVFLDTPGHEAFTAMRARGAHVTDIAVLVVAADDGVMPQTIESISHARAAGVPIIVAINKIDKPGADPTRVMKELSENGILVEDWGGDTISVPVSAKTGDGIKSLLEMILLQSEVLELKANPNRLASGSVVEAFLDKSRGSVATLLVMNGTLEVGMSVVAGTISGRIRVMTDYKGKRIKKAGPSTAVEITGLSEVPQAGDSFNALRDDKIARDIAESRKLRQREEIMSRTSGASLETLFSRINEGNMKELNIIIKGDVQGSVGALTSSLEKLSNEEVKVRIIHTGVGTVTESDVMLANTSDSIIIGFNVRPPANVAQLAEREVVEIRLYRVIYDAINEVEAAMKGMLDPEFKEVVLGQAEIRETFKVPGIGVIGGAYVTNGVIRRNAEVRIVRDGIVVHEGSISSLKRFKDDVREVATGYECGIGIEKYNDIKQGDVVEAFIMEEIERV